MTKRLPPTSRYAPKEIETCCNGAPVRVSCDADFYVMNGERVGIPMNKRNYTYKCESCGRNLTYRSPAVKSDSDQGSEVADERGNHD